MNLKEIEVARIQSEEHSQRIEQDEDEILDLVGSIRDEGLLQPIGVKKNDVGYVVVYGHSRFEALKRSGWEMIPCVILSGDEASMRCKTFAENFYRKELSPVELAVAIAEEYRMGRMTVERMAKGFRRSTDWIMRQIAICSWPEDVLEGIHTGKLSISAASNLALVEEEFYRQTLVRQAVENGATARTTAAWLQAWRSMLPPQEAIKQEPVPEGQTQLPMVPQAPCLACHEVFRTDELSHVPICRHCVKAISDAANSVRS